MNIIASLMFLSENTSNDCSQIVEKYVMVIVCPNIYPACQTDDNGIKPGSNLTIADKRVAEPSEA